MTLTLRAISLNGQPLKQWITAHFADTGGTIGRANHNTMPLPDPDRNISRLHAEVIAEGGKYTIRNFSAATAIIVRGRALAQGESALLHRHDELRIGGYLIVVDYDGAIGNAETAPSNRNSTSTRTPPATLDVMENPFTAASSPSLQAEPPPIVTAFRSSDTLFADFDPLRQTLLTSETSSLSAKQVALFAPNESTERPDAQPYPAPAARTGNADQLWQAFCEGRRRGRSCT